MQTNTNVNSINPTTILKHHIQQCQELIRALSGDSNQSPTYLINACDKSWSDARTMVRISNRFNHQYSSSGGPRVQSEIVDTLENLASRVQNASPSEQREFQKTLQKLAQTA